MADTLPIDSSSPALAELTRPAARRYTPSPEELARQAAAAQHLAEAAAKKGLSPEEYDKAGGHATDRHWLRDLDADSACPFEGAYRYPCLPLGGKS